jgi:hypothetical protein
MLNIPRQQYSLKISSTVEISSRSIFGNLAEKFSKLSPEHDSYQIRGFMIKPQLLFAVRRHRLVSAITSHSNNDK